MCTKRVNKQHGLVKMNSSRPKTKLRKRRNKDRARENKLKWMRESGLVAA